MDIAVLGVSIDPTGAQTGAAKAVDAVKKVDQAFTETADHVEQANKDIGKSTEAAAATVAAAADKEANAVTDAAKEIERAEDTVARAHEEAADKAQAAAAQTVAAEAQKAAAALQYQQAQQMAARTLAASMAQEQAARAAATAAVVTGSQSVVQSTNAATRAVEQVARTSAWDRIRQQAQNVGSSVSSGFASGFDRIVQGAQNMATRTTAQFQRVTTSARGMFNGLRGSSVDLLNAMGALNNPVGGLISRFDSFARVLRGIPGLVGPIALALGLLAGAFLATAAAVGTTFEAMSRAGPVQAAQLGLETVTGSAEQAENVLAALRENARRTGADITASLDTTIKFVGLGFSPADAVKLDRSIQDIAGTLGLSAARAQELGNALAQVQSKGVVSMEELRQQIAEKGIPVFDELAKKMGVSQAALIDMVGKGEVESKKLIDIFLNLEGGFQKFAGGAERGTAKLPGAISRLKANWNDLLITMGTPINDAVSPILNSISDKLDGMDGIAQRIGDSIAAGISANQGNIEGAIDSLIGKINGFFSMMNSDAGFWQAMAVNFWATFVSGGLSALEYITAGFATIGDVLERAVANFVEIMGTVTTPAFWEMVGVELYNAAVGMGNALIKAAESFVNLITNNLPDWMGGKKTVSFGTGFEKMVGSGAKVEPLEIYSVNNSDFDLTAIWDNNLEGMKSTLGETRDYWEQWKNKWNADNLQPISAKITGGALSTQGSTSSGGAKPGDMKKAAADAERMAKQMQSAADKYIKASMTPLESYKKTVDEINMLTNAGLLTAEQRTRALGDAAEDFSRRAEAAFNKLASPMEKLIYDWGRLKKNAQETTAAITDSISNNISGAIADFASGTKSASDAFDDMARAIVGDITQMITKMLIQYAISKALGWVTGAITGVPVTTVQAAPVMHTGGRVGQGGASRNVPASAFRGATTFAHGGTVASTGETPIIAEPGEQVLTRPQAADIKQRLGQAEESGEKGKGSITIVNVVDPEMIKAAISKDPNVVLNVLSSNASKVKRILELK